MLAHSASPSAENSIDSARAGRVSLNILAISEPHRAALAEWRDELQRLISKFEVCPSRTQNKGLCNLIATALVNTHAAIGSACRPAEARLVEDAAALIRRYFTHAGDVRAAVSKFPAVLEARDFIHAVSPANELLALVKQAKAAVKLIGRILDMGEVWHFSGLES